MNELIFSAPGRVELGGNHTDHQRGCVLAAAIDRTTRARVRLTRGPVVRVFSRGYDPVTLPLDQLSPREGERNTSAALVRGMAAAFARRGILWQGFDAWVESDVLPGSGLSSSAAFEVLLGRIGSALFAGGSLTPVEIAQMAQWAENVYFGKPCGLMDQLASSTGGLVFMDFRDPAAPEVRRLAGDRAVLRAIHVFDENRRVLAQVRALESGDVPGFLSLINASGASSWEYLQNIAPAGAAKHQALAVTLALCRRMLRGQGAVRVHGGGFAGTALCIVPEEKLSAFCRELETHLAPGCCHRLQIR